MANCKFWLQTKMTSLIDVGKIKIGGKKHEYYQAW